MKKNSISWIKALSVFVFFSTWLYPQVKTIRNIKPTDDENSFKAIHLTLLKEISSEINDDIFMVRPFNLAVDREGNIFTFDLKIRKVFKFTNKFEFVATFGLEGQGPGEYTKTPNPICVQIKDEKNLVLVDESAQKFLIYDLEGNHIEDQKFQINTLEAGLPVFDKNDNTYLIDTKNFCVQRIGKGIKSKQSFLSLKDYEESVEFIVTPHLYSMWVIPGAFNTYFETLGDDRFLIYLSGSSTFYLFKNTTLKTKKRIAPKEALFHYRRRLKLKNEKYKDSIFFMFSTFFVDQDTWNSFYLVRYGAKEILEFDLKGSLINRYRYPRNARIQVKKNGHFYGCYDDSIYIFREGRGL